MPKDAKKLFFSLILMVSQKVEIPSFCHSRESGNPVKLIDSGLLLSQE
jgi:hypothetical protein